ncbi:hypothetical protein R1sor_000443 [Riccia sorocarpa]|uniref:Protein kinase domain-containing protein n=1 Tax=Riccia sorocarpa TaxID=122646 RepID=A0ABD3GXA9_9MARC
MDSRFRTEPSSKASAKTKRSLSATNLRSPVEYYIPRKFLEFKDAFQKLVRPTPWSQRSRMYRPPPPPPPPPPLRPSTPEEDHLDFANQLKRVLEWEKLPFRLKVHKDFWAREDTVLESLYYQPTKDKKPKSTDVSASCKPYIPLILPKDAHEPECDLSCDKWDREANPPFLARLTTVKTLLGHHTFAHSFTVNYWDLLGKDATGSKIFHCKRVKPGIPQVSLDARRRFFRRKDYHHQVPVTYVVKVVDKSDPRSDKFRLYVEAICLTILLDHPNIVQCKEVFESEKKIYVVMERCFSAPGPLTLHDFFPVAENSSAQWVFQQLVDVVSYMHEMGVVHNNLKPENVMFIDDFDFTSDPSISRCAWRTENFSSIRVIDFNQAVYDPQLSSGYNPNFLPDDYFTPEEFLLCKADPQNDIRALGRILLAILVGRMPELGKYYPYRAREDHPEYEYRKKFDPRMIDLYERIFLAVQGEPDFPPSLEAIRNHPWVKEKYVVRDIKLQDSPVLSSDYMNSENSDKINIRYQG